MLNINDVQQMKFCEDSEGSSWMTRDGLFRSILDVQLGGQTSKDKTKTQLLVDLQKAGVDTTSKRCLKTVFVYMCCSHNISPSFNSFNVTPGWLGKLK